MYTANTIKNASTNRIPSSTSREPSDFFGKLSNFVNKEVYIKVEGEVDPINYLVKEVGKDYVVVCLAHIIRTIPLNRIAFFQQETEEKLTESGALGPGRAE
jgi:hypothetical protein